MLIDSDEESNTTAEKKSTQNDSSVCSLDFDEEAEADFAAFKKKKRKNVANQSLEFVKEEPLSQDLGLKIENEQVDSVENEKITSITSDHPRCLNCTQNLFASVSEHTELEKEFRKSIPREARSYMKKMKYKRIILVVDDESVATEEATSSSLGLKNYSCEKGEGVKLTQNCFIDETSTNCWQYFECVMCSAFVGLTLKFSNHTDSDFVFRYRNKILLFS